MNIHKSILACTFKLLVLGALISLTSACKEDSGPIADYANPIEAAYFEDYDSPAYKWGYINTKGEKVLKAKWDALKEMQPTLTAANYEGRWGYIDIEGTTKIDYTYKQATRFEDQRAFVQDFNNRWLLIDEQGTVIDSTDFSQVHTYDKGLCVVGRLGLKGVIDKGGQVVLPLQYKSIAILGDNKFIVKQGSSYTLLQGQTPLTTNEYDRLYTPSDGLIRFKQAKSYGYLDLEGKELSSQRYGKATNFESNLAAVQDGSQFSLIDKRLQIIRPIEADVVKSAGAGKWKFKRDDKWGLLNSLGEIILEPRYELMNKYNSDRIAVANQDKWGYCDENGQEVIPLQFPLVWDYSDGRARFIDDRGVGFIDKGGRMVISDNFIEVRDFSNGMARFQSYR